MTPAEFQSLRESLGLSVRALADIIEVKNERTIRNWESGDRQIPRVAMESLLALDQMAERIVLNGIELFREISAREVVVLRYESDADFRRYHPHMAVFPHAHRIHSAALSRLVRVARAMDVDLRIVSMVPDLYELWRLQTGAEDDDSARATWGAMRLFALGGEREEGGEA